MSNSELIILSDIEIENYISSLDLSVGTEAYRTFSSMLLLSPSVFIKAISALNQELISFALIKALPAVNDYLVENLILNRLSDTDISVLTYNYKTSWFPASVNVPYLKSTIPFEIMEYLESKLKTFTQFILKPEYDFFGKEETKFFTYGSALSAYSILAFTSGGNTLVNEFINFHNSFKIENPSLVQINDEENPILNAIKSLLTKSIFLERPDKIYNYPIIQWLLSDSFNFISYNTYNSFLNDLYVLQAEEESSDTLHNGSSGTLRMFNENPLLPIDSINYSKNFSYQQLARYYLPKAYGNLIKTEEELILEFNKINLLKNYLVYAREIIIKFRAGLTKEPITGFTVGSPMGLLLSLTYYTSSWKNINNFSSIFEKDTSLTTQVPGSPMGLLLSLTVA